MRRKAHGVTYTIAETAYEFGRHYVLYANGIPGFHSTDLKLVRNYMEKNM